MSKIIINILLWLTFVWLFSWFLVYLFFSWNNEKIDKPKDYSHFIWKELYKKSEDWKIELSKSELKKDELIENWFTREWIDIFSEIYSNKYDYTLSQKENSIDIELWNWTYFFDFKNPLKKVTIHWNIYDIILQNWWSLYVENWDNTVKIISFNAKAEIQYINRKTKKLNFRSYLYPHRYIGFRVRILKTKVNLYSLRLSKLTQGGLFEFSFNGILEKRNLWFIKSWWNVLKDGYNNSFLNDSNKEFLLNVINDYLNKKEVFEKDLIEVKNIKVWTVFWIDYIKDYFNLFFNKNKKCLYYKTIILDDIVRLFNEKKLNNDIILRIHSNLEKLKVLDHIEYEKVYSILESYYLLSLNDYNWDFVNSKTLYVNLFWKILNKKINDLLIYDIYNKFNFSWIDMFSELNKLFLKKVDLNPLEEDYKLLFMRDIVLNWFISWDLDNNNFNKLLDLFVLYSKSNDINFDDTDKNKISDSRKEIIIITRIIVNKDLLSVFNNSIRNRYFEKERKEWILINNSEKIIDIKLLKKWFNRYINFFDSNIDYLNSNDRYDSIIKKYSLLKSEFNEYSLALSDYALYKSKKSSFESLLMTSNTLSSEEENKLSKKKFIKFISKFKWVNINWIDLILDNKESTYDIKKININWKVFSFKLYPFRWNRIDSIVFLDNNINREDYNFYNKLRFKRYDLDDLKEDYEEKKKKEKLQNAEKYNFDNIFKIIFFPEVKNTNSVNTLSNNSKVERKYEDNVIRYFKWVKLLWNKWEFKNLESFMKIKYDNLFVKKVEWYDKKAKINFVDADLWFRIKKWNKLIMSRAYVDSDYKLEWDDHYFYNTKIKPYKKDKTWKNILLFWDNLHIKLIWKTDLLDFKGEMNKVISNIDKIIIEYNKNINEWFSIREINYELENHTFSFK